jgi:cytochrome c oxidase subunit 3
MSDVGDAIGARAERPVEGHFESMDQQAHAARLGMWVFLASELLLFAGLFALLVTYRMHYPDGFAEGVRHNTKTLGSINTGMAVNSIRRGRLRHGALLVAATMALGGAFLAVKVVEYVHHFREGIYPGGEGLFFSRHASAGLPVFWTLYFVVTGLHAVHVMAGMILLGSTLLGMFMGKITAKAPQRIELAAIYWHLVDVIWIFLWPLLYLVT